MTLSTLTIDHLRCLDHVELELHPRHNLIWGSNGSGKTSILEALFLLGRGRSFRTRSSERLIQFGQDQLVVFGRTAGVPSHALGIQVARGPQTVAKIDSAFVASLAQLSRTFAVQVIEPGIHRLIEEGGHRRRRWLDWGVFHVEPRFMEAWSSYARALKQRNAALRTQPAVADVWDSELIRLGEFISEARRQFLLRLEPHWSRIVSQLTDRSIELHYSRGWNQELSLAEALLASRTRDGQRGLTHPGPHRGDVNVRSEGKPARDVLSRGQQKLAAVAMNLAQLYLLREDLDLTPTLLLDDPAAELDRIRLKRFTDQVEALNCQLVVTALNADLDPLGQPDSAFHVEHGKTQIV